MFARESDAVSPRLGDTNLVFSVRTLNSLYTLFCESIFAIVCFKGDKVSLRVCNFNTCQKVAWRNDFWSRFSARGNSYKNRSRHHKIIKFCRRNISKIKTENTILRTKAKIITLKVVVAAAIVTVTAAVAQSVRTR